MKTDSDERKQNIFLIRRGGVKQIPLELLSDLVQAPPSSKVDWRAANEAGQADDSGREKDPKE